MEFRIAGADKAIMDSMVQSVQAEALAAPGGGSSGRVTRTRCMEMKEPQSPLYALDGSELFCTYCMTYSYIPGDWTSFQVLNFQKMGCRRTFRPAFQWG